MRNYLIAMAVTSLLFGGGLPNAKALFVNGGFEDGDFNGWSYRFGDYNGGGLGGINWGVSQSSYGLVQIVGKTGYTDPKGLSQFNKPFYGDYMARLNPVDGGGHDVTQIWQTGTVAASDVGSDGKYHLYFGWGAVLDNPGHASSQNPFFDVEVLQNTVSIYHVNHQSGDSGWTQVPGTGSTSDPWYYSSANLDIDKLALGDTVEVILTIADCSPSAHDGYAYIDGFGSKYVPPPVPDGGSTAYLVLMGLAGLAGFYQKCGKRV